MSISVCLSARISQKPNDRTLPNFYPATLC